MTLSTKKGILKALYFSGGFTTEIYFRLKEMGMSVGIKSCSNRLQELRSEGKITSREVKDRQEMFYELAKVDKSGKLGLL